MCRCVVGLLPMQDPQGCVWLSQNVPITLLSCFSDVIDSYCTDGLLLLPRGEVVLSNRAALRWNLGAVVICSHLSRPS